MEDRAPRAGRVAPPWRARDRMRRCRSPRACRFARDDEASAVCGRWSVRGRAGTPTDSPDSRRANTAARARRDRSDAPPHRCERRAALVVRARRTTDGTSRDVRDRPRWDAWECRVTGIDVADRLAVQLGTVPGKSRAPRTAWVGA